MRAVWITKPGGPEALEVRETADPGPGPGEVRIRVRAAGLNFAEVMAAQGLYPDAPKPPCVVGYEVAGVIDTLGERTQGWAAGNRVLAMTHFGGHADVVCVPAEQVLQIPDAMSFEEAAAIPVNYLTAYHMLFRVACVRPGERVLVHMAAGGVGMAVLQLCRTVDNLEVFGTASAGKHEVLRAEGCAHPIDYRTTDYATEVRRLTGGEGVDIVLDPLGGNDWRKGLKLLRPFGRLVAFGFANLASGQRRRPAHLATQVLGIPLLTPLQLMNRNQTVSGVNIGHLWDQMAVLHEELQAVLALWDKGSIKPHIDRTYLFTEAAAAHRRMLQRRNIGKVLLKPLTASGAARRPHARLGHIPGVRTRFGYAAGARFMVIRPGGIVPVAARGRAHALPGGRYRRRIRRDRHGDRAQAGGHRRLRRAGAGR